MNLEANTLVSEPELNIKEIPQGVPALRSQSTSVQERMLSLSLNPEAVCVEVVQDCVVVCFC